VSNTIFSLDQVKGILNLKVSYTGHCEYCGKGSLVIRYSVETYEGKKYLLCEDCGEQIIKAKKEV
jgi:predicted SprT family Zn-dependent metalloprotease